MTIPTCEVYTSDTTFAAAMMARGGRLVNDWTEKNGRVEWHIAEIPPNAVEDFKSGRDGFQAFSRSRRFLCDVARTVPRTSDETNRE